MASERNAVGIDELLAHAGWARSLARSLVRDTSTADDVVQDTWLAALHAGPKNRGNLRGWLARAVTNVAARRARADERRSRRETDHDAREPLPTPEELALELDTQRILAEEVARLPEPLRSVVLLRFYSGRTAHEIALDAGVSEVAVRARLREALARLRARLDARHGQRDTWMLAVTSLARHAHVIDAVTSSASMSVPYFGGVAMTAKTFVGISAALVAVCAKWLCWPDPTTPEPLVTMPAVAPVQVIAAAENTTAEPALPVEQHVPPTSTERAVATSMTPTPVAAPAVPSASVSPKRPLLSGSIVVDGTRRVPEELKISLDSIGGLAAIDRTTSAYSITKLPRNPEFLTVTSEETLPLRIAVPPADENGVRRLDLELDASRALRVLAVDARTGAPAPGVELVYETYVVFERTVEATLGWTPRVSRRTDARGECRFTGLPASGSITVREASSVGTPDAASFTLAMNADSPLEQTARVVVGAARATVSGSVPATTEGTQVLRSRILANGRTSGHETQVPLATDGTWSFECDVPSAWSLLLRVDGKVASNPKHVEIEEARMHGLVDLVWLSRTPVDLRFVGVPQGALVSIWTIYPTGLSDRVDAIPAELGEHHYRLELIGPARVQIDCSVNRSVLSQAGLVRLVSVDPAVDRELVVDLHGDRPRTIELTLDGEAPTGTGLFAMLALDGEKRSWERTVFDLVDGRSEAMPLPRPEGRYFYRFESTSLRGLVTGVVDAQDEAGPAIVRIDWKGKSVARRSLEAGVELISLDGHSLAASWAFRWPENWAGEAALRMPRDCEYRVID